MIRLPRDMSYDDVQQWLAGGHYLVRTKRSGNHEWVVCRWVGMDAGRVVSAPIDGSAALRTAHTSCAAVWPEMGSFNTEYGYAVHMTRIVERQYRRTYHHRMIETVVPWMWRVSVSLGADQSTLGTWAVVSSLPFKHTYPESLDDALRRIENGAVTVAVNRRLIVAGDRRSEKRLFYVDGVLAANVIGGRLHMVCRPEVERTLTKMLGGRYDCL